MYDHENTAAASSRSRCVMFDFCFFYFLFRTFSLNGYLESVSGSQPSACILDRKSKGLPFERLFRYLVVALLEMIGMLSKPMFFKISSWPKACLNHTCM